MTISDFAISQGDRLAINISALPLGKGTSLGVDQLIYDRRSGLLSVDADGTGPGEARPLALLGNQADLRPDAIDLWQQPTAASTPSPAPTRSLRVSQRIDAETMAPGDTVTVLTTLENPDPEPLDSVDLVVELPAGVTLTGSRTDLLQRAVTVRSTQGSTVLTMAVGPLAAGERLSLPITLQLPDTNTAQLYTLRTSASGQGNTIHPSADPSALCPASELTLRVAPRLQPDLVITSLQGSDNHALHQPFESFLIVDNQGTTTAEHVLLTTVIPSGMTIVSLSGAVATEIADRVIRFELGTLQPGDHRTLGLTLSSIVAGTHTIVSEISCPSVDSDPFNNVAETRYTIRSERPTRSDLQLNLTASDRNPVVGERVALTATLSNQGPGDSAGPLVALACPEGLALESVEAQRGQYDPDTGLWDVGSLGIGASCSLQLGARVLAPGLWLAEAEVVDQANPDVDSIAGNARIGEDDQAIIAIRASQEAISKLQVVAGPRRIVAGADALIAVPLTYTDATRNSRLQDLELAMHFDSRALQFNGVSQAIPPLAMAPRIEADLDDRDRNPATDRRVVLRWQAGSTGAGSQAAIPLLTATFRSTTGFTDTLIGLSSGNTIAGSGFCGDPIAIQRRPWNLDIDDDGRIDNVTDGALLLRYAFGYDSGPDLIRSLIGTGARRRTADAIGAYLQEGVRSGALDLDGNGRFDALSDALMVIRYNADMASGDQLTAGALALDATITDSSAIAAQLQRLTTLL